ncbi:MAG: hypothetical protein HQL61_18270, partial [Magnetococcales bacterium]|nr:hypothetical protein [Nitrospirota bacterium]
MSTNQAQLMMGAQQAKADSIMTEVSAFADDLKKTLSYIVSFGTFPKFTTGLNINADVQIQQLKAGQPKAPLLSTLSSLFTSPPTSSIGAMT